LAQQIDLDELKKNPSVLKVFTDRIRMRKESGELVGLCPFHNEKSSSFHVSAAPDGTWIGKCFGCGKAVNCFQFVQEVDKVPMRQAIEIVQASVGDWDTVKNSVDQVFKPVAADAEPKKTFTLPEYGRLEQALLSSQAALDWLTEERGISLEIAQRLHLGFKQDIGRLAGEKNSAIAASGWVAFPCIEEGLVVSIKYRSVVAKAFSKQPGMATALFNTESIDLFDPVYVCEGEMDVATLEQAGYRAVSLASASSHPTPSQKDQMMAANVVYLAGDSDEVGSASMDKLWRELGERAYKIEWPEGMKDANQTFLELCNRDVKVFADLMEELTAKSRVNPMPDVYSLPELMMSSNQGNLADHPERLRFPWPEVDKMAILLPGSVLAVIATQTGQGKSCWVNEVCLYGARNQNEVVLNYQCELSTEEMVTMNTANILRKDRNHLEKVDRQQASRFIRDIKYYVGNNPSLNSIDPVLDLLEAAIRRLSATVVVLDHIHFLTANSQNENQTQTNAMNRIKQMAQKYRVKFIVVGQPRKANQQTKGKRTHITDAKGSESFSSSSDAYIALHRDLVKDIDPANPPRDMYDPKTEVNLLKARSKGEGAATTTLLFMGQYASFDQIDYRYGDAA
jgi:replicative DNA helicase